MVRYQVEYRAYAAKYEDNPPPWQAEPWSNITKVMGEAKLILRRRIQMLLERTYLVGFDAIVEVRLVDDKGKVHDYRKTRVSPRFR